MASPIEFAKNHILNEIDDEVLAFSFNAGYNNEIIGTMSILENKIIRNIVIRELNMLDGEEKRIPFTACRVLFHGNDNMLIEIPPITLNNRPIITVDSITSGILPQGRINKVGGLTGVAMNMLNTNSPTDMYSNCKTEVINNNIVKISDVSYVEPNAIINLRVQSNPNMSNLPLTTHIDFAELCLLATQKWIYAKKRKDINIAILKGGAELSVLKEIVDEWNDAKELYKEKRMKFIAIMNMSDKLFMNDQIKVGLGNLTY